MSSAILASLEFHPQNYKKNHRQSTLTQYNVIIILVFYHVTLTPILTRTLTLAVSLAVSWAGTLYIHFPGFLPLTEFCRVKNSLYVQVLRSIISAALLHCTRAVGVNQILRRDSAGRPSRGTSVPHLLVSSQCFAINYQSQA